MFYEQAEVKVQAAGAGAVNQAVKAIAVARGYIATRGMDLIVRPGFINIEGRDGVQSSLPSCSGFPWTEGVRQTLAAALDFWPVPDARDPSQVIMGVNMHEQRSDLGKHEGYEALMNVSRG